MLVCMYICMYVIYMCVCNVCIYLFIDDVYGFSCSFLYLSTLVALFRAAVSAVLKGPSRILVCYRQVLKEGFVSRS
jgi:hypothetical protein